MAQTLTNKNRLLEKYSQVVREDGLNTNKNVNIGINGSTPSFWAAGPATFGGTVGFGSGSVVTLPANTKINGEINVTTPVAVNATATLTAAQVLSGYITSTSAAAVTMTLPTGTLLGAALGAVQGTWFEFIIDNTAGANTVTLAVSTNGILSAAATAGSSAGAGLLTVPSGVTGQGQFEIMFSSATAFTFSRVA
jgi:hypothetical protein